MRESEERPCTSPKLSREEVSRLVKYGKCEMFGGYYCPSIADVVRSVWVKDASGFLVGGLAALVGGRCVCGCLALGRFWNPNAETLNMVARLVFNVVEGFNSGGEVRYDAEYDRWVDGSSQLSFQSE